MKKISANAPRWPPETVRNPKPRHPQVADTYNEAADRTEDNGLTADAA